MWLENVLLPWLAGRVFVCECVFKRGWLGGGGGGVLLLPRQRPQLCNIIWCGVNKKHPAMCTTLPYYQCCGGNR